MSLTMNERKIVAAAAAIISREAVIEGAIVAELGSLSRWVFDGYNTAEYERRAAVLPGGLRTELSRARYAAKALREASRTLALISQNLRPRIMSGKDIDIAQAYMDVKWVAKKAREAIAEYEGQQPDG
jgi:hypothetical protein